MAYGDDRTVVATETFGGTLADWDNGWGDWFDWVISSGNAENNTNAEDTGMRHTGGTFDGDQYAIATVSGTQPDNSMGVMLRCQSGTDESCYTCTADPYDFNYRISVWDNTKSDTELKAVSDATNIPLTTGETISGEVVGTTIRVGSDSAGSDAEKGSVTDSTLSSGPPGLFCYATSTISVSDWVGGDIGVTSSWPRGKIFSRPFTGPFGGPI